MNEILLNKELIKCGGEHGPAKNYHYMLGYVTGMEIKLERELDNGNKLRSYYYDTVEFKLGYKDGVGDRKWIESLIK